VLVEVDYGLAEFFLGGEIEIEGAARDAACVENILDAYEIETPAVEESRGAFYYPVIGF